jgi:hypothetical protein
MGEDQYYEFAAIDGPIAKKYLDLKRLRPDTE